MYSNIAFFYEDIGDADNVIKYGDLILDRYRNNLIKVPVIEKSLTLNGLAYSYLHIQNVIDKTVGEELVKRSFEFLKFAERQLHSVVPIEYLADINIITELPNTMVVVSSRNSEKSLADFSGIQINELENKVVINYLRHAGITFTKNYDPKSLRLPIYLKRFVSNRKRRLRTDIQR